MTRTLPLLGLALLGFAIDSAAQVPSLAGENLIASYSVSPTGQGGTGTLTVWRNCNPSGTSTFTFQASGPAIGPYPGTFVESGTVTIGPHSIVFPNVPPNAGFLGVATVQSSFRIEAANGTLTGTRRPLTVGVYYGSCADFEQGDAVLALAQFNGFLDYDATIVTNAGRFGVQGRASLTAGAGTTMSQTGAVLANGNFHEMFVTSEPRVLLGPATLLLTPTGAYNDVASTHTVTATVLDATGAPVTATQVLFTVTGAINTTGFCVTDQNGQCTFTYRGPLFPGVDEITAFADSDNDDALDPGEPTATAYKTWVLPRSTAGHATGGGQVGAVTFGFNAKTVLTKRREGQCHVTDRDAGITIRCLDVTSYVQVGPRATFFGNAVVNGVGQTYRIDVSDVDESGSMRDTFVIHTDGGYAAGGPLTHGNVQVR